MKKIENNYYLYKKYYDLYIRNTLKENEKVLNNLKIIKKIKYKFN